MAASRQILNVRGNSWQEQASATPWQDPEYVTEGHINGGPSRPLLLPWVSRWCWGILVGGASCLSSNWVLTTLHPVEPPLPLAEDGVRVHAGFSEHE